MSSICDGLIIDYAVARECRNQDTLYICHKCGECGRKFENGFMVDDGGTHVDDEEDLYADE